MMDKKINSVWQGLVKPEPVRAKRVPLSRFPKAMRMELHDAIRFLEFVCAEIRPESDWVEVLDEYRRNKAYGVVINPHYLINMNRQYPGLDRHVQRVDAAFMALHNYIPEDHLSEGVYRLAQRKNSEHERPNAKKREAFLKKIGAWLAKNGYKDSDNKSDVITKAMEEFKKLGCKRTDVTDAARLANLTRSYRKSPR